MISCSITIDQYCSKHASTVRNWPSARKEKKEESRNYPIEMHSVNRPRSRPPRGSRLPRGRIAAVSRSRSRHAAHRELGHRRTQTLYHEYDKRARERVGTRCHDILARLHRDTHMRRCDLLSTEYARARVYTIRVVHAPCRERAKRREEQDQDPEDRSFFISPPSYFVPRAAGLFRRDKRNEIG